MTENSALLSTTNKTQHVTFYLSVLFNKTQHVTFYLSVLFMAFCPYMDEQ
jgi:hypothetical protein